LPHQTQQACGCRNIQPRGFAVNGQGEGPVCQITLPARGQAPGQIGVIGGQLIGAPAHEILDNVRRSLRIGGPVAAGARAANRSEYIIALISEGE